MLIAVGLIGVLALGLAMLCVRHVRRVRPQVVDELGAAKNSRPYVRIEVSRYDPR